MAAPCSAASAGTPPSPRSASASALVTNFIAAVAAALAWLALVEGIIGQLIGDASRWLPFALGSALNGLPGVVDDPPQWQAGLALAGYAAAFTGAAVATTVRRGIT